MSESIRGRQWRRQRRVIRVLGAAFCICAAIYLSVALSPPVIRGSKRILSRHKVSASHPAKMAPSRPVYPYSVIRGGAYSAAELTDALLTDPVVAHHYSGFHRSSVRMVRSTFSEPVFLSYRIGSAVYWTSRPVRLPQGETLLTDGKNYARARCGNRISPAPQTPVNETEPAPETMNTPHPPVNTIADLTTWSEDRLVTFDTPSFIQSPGQPTPLSTVASIVPEAPITPSWWTPVFPGGVLPAPIPVPFPPYTPPLIQPNPIPGLIFPPIPEGPPIPVTPPPTTTFSVVIPPNIFPPDVWPPTPTVPIIPGLPPIPIGPETPPTTTVPEPSLLLPTLLACIAIGAARLARRS